MRAHIVNLMLAFTGSLSFRMSIAADIRTSVADSTVRCGMYLQFVPTPAKEHLQFLESQALAPQSLHFVSLQILFVCQIRLECTHRLASLKRAEAQLLRLLQNAHEDNAVEHTQQQSQQKGKSTGYIGKVGLWLGNPLATALFTQGPFCAALLMKVCFQTFISHFLMRTPRRGHLGAAVETCGCGCAPCGHTGQRWSTGASVLCAADSGVHGRLA